MYNVYNLALNKVSNVSDLVSAATCYDVDKVERSLEKLAEALKRNGLGIASDDIRRALNFSCSYDDFKAALFDARESIQEAAALKRSKVTE